MTTVEMRRRAKRKIESLTPGQLQSALDFIDFLRRRREEEEATRELEGKPGFARAMKEAQKDIASGRLVDWRKVCRHV